MTPTATVVQINRLLSPLIRAGLIVDSNFAHERRTTSGLFEVTFAHADHLAAALRPQPYFDVYLFLAGKRAYNAMLDDGAILQMNYLFDSRQLKRHRLAYLGAPSPLSEARGAESQAPTATNDPATVFRFDYDDQEHHDGALHPKAHLTIGRAEHCRIPVSRPLTPAQFLDFVLRNFRPSWSLPMASFADGYPPCLSSEARALAHLTIPAARG